MSQKRGQIAHLDQNPNNSSFDNIAFLCFDHHDQYDSRTSQSKGITIHEVKLYRSNLYGVLEEVRQKQEKHQGAISKYERDLHWLILFRIGSGKELVELAIDAHFYYFDHDEVFSVEEADLIGGFGDLVIEECEDSGSLGISARLRTEIIFNTNLDELDSKGFIVFGRRIQSMDNKNGRSWDSAILHVLRSNNSEIINLDDLRNI